MNAGAHEALKDLGNLLKTRRYRFTAVTPSSHERVLKRGNYKDDDVLRNLFGWNIPVRPESVPEEALKLLFAADAAEVNEEKIRSRVRFSTLGEALYLHSAFPTTPKDAVFFGPDTYRFVRFLKQVARKYSCVLDVGCGSGAGGLSLIPAENIWLADISRKALEFAAINAQINGVERVSFFESDVLRGVPAGADLIVANPPFIQDQQNRYYRDGGAWFGSELSYRIVDSALNYLNQEGG